MRLVFAAVSAVIVLEVGFAAFVALFQMDTLPGSDMVELAVVLARTEMGEEVEVQAAAAADSKSRSGTAVYSVLFLMDIYCSRTEGSVEELVQRTRAAAP